MFKVNNPFSHLGINLHRRQNLVTVNVLFLNVVEADRQQDCAVGLNSRVSDHPAMWSLRPVNLFPSNDAPENETCCLYEFVWILMWFYFVLLQIVLSSRYFTALKGSVTEEGIYKGRSFSNVFKTIAESMFKLWYCEIR